MLQEILLVLAVCTDCFITSFAYGKNHIKIPLISAIIIGALGSLFLGISLGFSAFIGSYINPTICKYISFLILFLVGITGVFSNSIKSRFKNRCKQVKFKLAGLNFFIEVCMDETKADKDKSKEISCGEAFTLAIALSVDSLVSGVGAGLLDISIFGVTAFTFILGVSSVIFGSYIGRRKNNSELNANWIGGFVLIILAFVKLFI